ncbi:MAG TPA: type VII secretion protein EccB [Pseudonocardiaceae bacterium]|nr:type VII secretion protein EccB [Pseudonocardiaceae bacterium]
MSKDPATTSQVQAYRFVLRRMESALVRKDAVMLHEPMRHHLRATAVGLILGVLGLVAFFVVGKFSPTSQISSNEIVIGSPSEAVFVVQDNPRRLIPVLNLTSARLLLAAISPSQGASEAKRVADSALADIGRAPSTGLPGAPPLPAPENLIRGVWSVCDTATVRQDLPNDAGSQLSTTVLIREGQPPGRRLGDDQALLVAEQSTAATYFVWRGQRRQVDLRDPAVRFYRLGNVVPRKTSTGLLNAIPEGRPLTLPIIPSGRPLPQLPGVQVGDVVRVKGVRDSFFLVLPQGVQPVEPAAADLIRFGRSTSADFANVTPEAISRVPEAPLASQLDLAGFPAQVPQILKTSETPIACLTWQGPDQDPVISISPEERLPLDDGGRPVEVPPAASGQTADSVFLKPTKGALVRGVVPGQRLDTGAIWLVTDQGLRYGLPTIEVARALGLGEITTPAPESILGLLPIGPTLDPQRALELFNPELASQQAEQRAGR